jgi:hypothetical protein
MVQIKEAAKAKFAAMQNKLTVAAVGVGCALVPTVTALADGESSASTLELNFDATQLFTYTNIITNSMMPLVYISAGFALGFTIIYSLKNAFSSRM